jgi:hypothetical protein
VQQQCGWWRQSCWTSHISQQGGCDLCLYNRIFVSDPYLEDDTTYRECCSDQWRQCFLRSSSSVHRYCHPELAGTNGPYSPNLWHKLNEIRDVDLVLYMHTGLCATGELGIQCSFLGVVQWGFDVRSICRQVICKM